MQTVQDQPIAACANQVLKVLVIDDDHEDVDYLRRLLSRAGCRHEILEANSLEQGLKSLDDEPDVVLLDYFLGANTGLDFLARLETGKRYPPIVMLTGADDADVNHGELSGVLADYLPKKNIDAGILTRAINYAHRDATRLRQLEYLAHYDPLTGLCNRRLFMDRFEHAFHNVRRHKTRGALLYIDIDGFKQINDELGHDAGDELLKQVGKRMIEIVRSTDSVGRLGGDEFVILLENITTAEAHWVAQKLLSTMDEPITLVDRSVRCSLSIGLCAFSDESASTHHILVNADRALYQAKVVGKHTYCSFNKRLVASLDEQQRLEAIVHEAIEAQQFKVIYQPRVAQGSRRIDSLAVQFRFPGIDHAVLPDSLLLKMIESLGWIESFQRMLIEKALTELAQQPWDTAQHPLAISLPTEAKNLDAFCRWLMERLVHFGINANHVELELKEEQLLDASDALLTALDEMRAMGCRMVLVDFGCGPCSLQSLVKVPLSAIVLSDVWCQLNQQSATRSVLLECLVQVANRLNVPLQLLCTQNTPQAGLDLLVDQANVQVLQTEPGQDVNRLRVRLAPEIALLLEPGTLAKEQSA